MALQHLRSGTANKRPIPTAMSDGQLAVNTNLASPGLFFKDSNGDLVKAGPVHVGTTAPNASPASTAATALVANTVYQILTTGTSDFTAVGASSNAVGVVFTATGTTTGTGTVSGQQGVEKGEQWLDTTNSLYVMKVYDGTGWRVTDSISLANGTAAAPSLHFGSDTNTGLFRSAADSLAITTAGTSRLTVNDDGSIVIPGTLTGQGQILASEIIVNSAGTAGAPSYRFGLGTGFFSATGTGNVSISTNSTERLTIDSSGRLLLGTTTEGQATYAEKLTIADAGHCGMTIRSGSSSYGSIYFSDGTSGSAEYAGFVEYYHNGDYLRLGAGGAERLRVDNAGRLLLGTTTVGFNTVDNLTIADSGDCGITIRSGASSSGSIYFADGTSGSAEYEGFIDYQQTAGHLRFGTGGGQERMRINSSGKVGVAITPYAWEVSTNSAVLQVRHGVLNDYISTQFDVGRNYYYTGSEYKYGSSSTAERMTFFQGNTIFSNAASGSANAAFAWSEKMRISSAGRLGIGTSAPTHALHVVGDYIRFTAANAALGTIYIGAETNVNSIYSQDSAGNAEDFRFMSGSSEYARITGNGYFHASPNASYYGNIASGFYSFDQSTSQWSVGIRSTHSTPYGLIISYSGAAPNNAGSSFIYASDNSALRFHVKSNGGVDNYSGNNVGLSDEREKKDIAPLDTKWEEVKSWELKKFRFNDDEETEHLRYGVIAQQIEVKCPEIVTDWQKLPAKEAVLDEEGNVVTPAEEAVMRKGVKDQQMTWMAIKALQEAMTKIETLEAKVAALEAG